MSKFRVNTTWFEAQFANIGYSKRKVARELEIDPSSFIRILDGTRKLQLEEAIALTKILGKSLEEIIENVGLAADQPSGVQIVGWVDGAGKVHIEAPRGSRSAPQPAPAGDDVRAVRYQTSGSFDGALVYYRPMDELTSDVIGKPCVIEISGRSGWCLGSLRRGYSSGTYKVLRLDGEVFADDARVRSASPILWIKF